MRLWSLDGLSSSSSSSRSWPLFSPPLAVVASSSRTESSSSAGRMAQLPRPTRTRTRSLSVPACLKDFIVGTCTHRTFDLVAYHILETGIGRYSGLAQAGRPGSEELPTPRRNNEILPPRLALWSLSAASSRARSFRIVAVSVYYCPRRVVCTFLLMWGPLAGEGVEMIVCDVSQSAMTADCSLLTTFSYSTTALHLVHSWIQTNKLMMMDWIKRATAHLTLPSSPELSGASLHALTSSLTVVPGICQFRALTPWNCKQLARL